MANVQSKLQMDEKPQDDSRFLCSFDYRILFSNAGPHLEFSAEEIIEDSSSTEPSSDEDWNFLQHSK